MTTWHGSRLQQLHVLTKIPSDTLDICFSAMFHAM